MGDAMKTYERGTEIPTAWWRNNHVGGFIRYSIVRDHFMPSQSPLIRSIKVPIDQSDSQDAFDSAENMLSYECNQVGCDATYGGSAPNSKSTFVLSMCKV